MRSAGTWDLKSGATEADSSVNWKPAPLFNTPSNRRGHDLFSPASCPVMRPLGFPEASQTEVMPSSLLLSILLCFISSSSSFLQTSRFFVFFFTPQFLLFFKTWGLFLRGTSLMPPFCFYFWVQVKEETMVVGKQGNAFTWCSPRMSGVNLSFYPKLI